MDVKLPRDQWVRALSSLPRGEVRAAAERLAMHFEVTPMALPQAGLGLLQMKDGAFGQAYFLGEFPLSRAHLLLRSADGRTGEGAAQVMEDDEGWAEALAICDGVLANRLEGWGELAALLEAGRARFLETERRRKAMLAATRVSFALMSEADGPNED